VIVGPGGRNRNAGAGCRPKVDVPGIELPYHAGDRVILLTIIEWEGLILIED